MPRHSAAVYRRRRVAVIGIALLILAMIGAGTWLAIAQPWASDAVPASSAAPSSPAPSSPAPSSPAPSDSAAPDASGEPEPEKTPDGAESGGAESEESAPAACVARDIEVTAVTDKDTYGAEELPQLSISLKNLGDLDCTMNVGSSTQKFTIMSGTDTWWRSTDCQTDPSDMIVTIKAGTTVGSVTPVVWDRTRSAVETCAEKNRQRAPGNGASYHLSVSIGGFDSVITKQIILR